MHTGKDDEDLQKALAFWLIAIRLGGRFQSGEARQSGSVNNPKSNKFCLTFLCLVLLIPTVSLSLPDSLSDSIFQTETFEFLFCVGNGHMCIVLW